MAVLNAEEEAIAMVALLSGLTKRLKDLIRSLRFITYEPTSLEALVTELRITTVELYALRDAQINCSKITRPGNTSTTLVYTVVSLTKV